jgi:hypothetical protein
MVWNDIIAWVNGNFAQLGVGALTVLEFAKMIGNRLNFNKVYTSTVTPITSSNNVVFNKVNEAIGLVTKLTNEVQTLKAVSMTKDKQIETLSSLVVSTLSIANVPTSAKQEFFNAITKAKVVSDDASLVLAKMIEAKQRQDANVQLINDEAITALKNGA